MIFLIAVLFIIIVFLLSYLFLIKKELKYLSNQLKLIKELETNKRLLTNFQEPTLIKLVEEMNGYITLKKNLEQQNKQSQRSRQNLILNISHDLRTPLTAIRGYLQMLETEKIAPQQQKCYLKIINQKIFLLNQQLDSFFELAKLDSGDASYPLDLVDAYPVLTNLLISYYEDFEKQEISMEVKLTQPLKIKGNVPALEKIFHNVVVNTLQNAQSWVQIEGYQEGKCIVFKISNDTLDFQAENLPLLFDKFATFSKKTAGNGLGLFIVKELVSQMKGQVKADYHEDCLSITFYFLASDV